MPLVLCSNTLRAEVAVLLKRISEADQLAENSRLSDADRHANRLRDQLAEKRSELFLAEQAEADKADAVLHAQQLAALHEIEADEAHGKGEVLSLQRELAVLPGKLQLTQQRHARLLKTKAALKREMGL